MKEEVLRLDRVTILEQGATVLNHFSLNLFAGEIMGLIPVNGTGLPVLMRLLRQNIPLHYGYVYYRERLVNHWRYADMKYNRIGVIDNRSGLAGGLTVTDNVFVLRHGFRKHVVSRAKLDRLLAPFLTETGVAVVPGAYARDLTALQRLVVEIVKAVVAGCRLIIINDAGTVISDVELEKLHGVLRLYARQGVSFLYVSRHYEEIRHLCGKVALMVNGQIAKVLSTEDTGPDMIHCFGVENYERLVLSQGEKRRPDAAAPPALSIKDVYWGEVAGLALSIAPGECVAVQDLENRIFDDLIAAVAGPIRAPRGEVRVRGRKRTVRNNRDIAVIERLAPKTMLFPELSYLDNLCFTMDHRLPGIWRDARARRSVRAEYAPWLGDAVFDKSVDELTQAEKYDLVYARILLQRPAVAICVQPFMEADVEQRMHIFRLVEKLLGKGIAVMILAVNLADTLSLADRLVRVQNGRVLAAYERSEFGTLPDSAPWQHLWNGAGGQG